MLGLLSNLERKNCWTIAEERGDVTPHGLQHMLSRASWDEDAVAGDVRDYVTTALADPDAVLVVDLCRPRNYAEAPVAWSERLCGGGSLVAGRYAVVGMITGFPGTPAPRHWAGSGLVVSRPAQ
jgi:SRSO17 transposase